MTNKEAIEKMYEIAMSIVNWAIDEQEFEGEDLLEVLEDNLTRAKNQLLETIIEQ